MLKEATAHLPNIRIEFFKGLLVDFAQRPRRRRDREGPAGRLRLRLRAADGADEPAALGHRHVLHLDEPAALVPVVEPGAGGRPVRRRRLGHGARRTCRPARRDVRQADRSARRTERCSRTSPSKVPDTADAAARSSASIARRGAHDADVGVGDGQPRRVRRDRCRTRSTALPEELRQAALAAEGARRGPRAGRARGRAASSTSAARSGAERMVEKTEVVREAAPHRRGDRRRRRDATPPRSGTRPRTTSTASSPRSRWCSTARCSGRKGPRAAPGARARRRRRRAEADDDEQRFFDQDDL